MTTNTNTTVQALPAQTLKAFTDRIATLASVERTESANVEAAEWQRFNTSADAMSALGSFIVDKVIPRMVDQSKTGGDAVRKSFADKSSGVYVADSDVRSTIPNGSKLTECMAVSRLDSADRRTAYKTAGNAPRVRDYIAWAKLDAGEDLAGKTTVDVEATRRAGGDSGRPGKLTRKPSTPVKRTTATVVGFGADILADGADLQAIIDAAPIDVEATFAGMSADDRKAIARALFAWLTRDESADKRTVALISKS